MTWWRSVLDRLTGLGPPRGDARVTKFRKEGFVKILGSSEHEGARRSKVGKTLIDALKGWPLRAY